jgi:hypothetical protein
VIILKTKKYFNIFLNKKHFLKILYTVLLRILKATVLASVVAVIFQNVFYSEMHQNNFFKKKLFLIPTYQNNLETPKQY